MRKLPNKVELSLEDMNIKLHKYKKNFCIEVFTNLAESREGYGRHAKSYVFSSSEEIKELIIKIWFGGGHAVIWKRVSHRENITSQAAYVTDLHNVKDFHEFADN